MIGYVFEVIWAGLADSCHQGGGALVSTDGDLIQVLDEYVDNSGLMYPNDREVLDIEPDLIWLFDTAHPVQTVSIFLNQGCC